MRAGIPISAAVEGDIDEAVLRRIVACAGGTVGTVYGKKGRLHLQRKISAFNQAAQRWPWVVLADLDNDPRCAPLLVAEWLPSPAQHMCLRIAVREIESWLLADPDAFLKATGKTRPPLPSHKSPEELWGEHPSARRCGFC